MCLSNLVKLIHIAGLVTLIQACGSPHTSPQLKQYIDMFNAEMAARGLSQRASPMFFDDNFKSNEIAFCMSKGTKSLYVRVNKAIWDTLTTNEREMVTFHEQGHCAFKYHGHVLDNPSNLMSPVIPWELDWEHNRSAIIDELIATVQK